ncbi:hypothetical protein BDP55DRAFT_237683 [Colletotrichum godetiae]|uniref:Uncharacterized protein n=1 Tax=Colletotrichum godetiae TaxID=1209918 RepID=A0AAJ0AGU7_9PEZI|nr:uncharacterized protein BDP55DRAFT_237683 [Colletotrichum godetiae]KAK1673004.1 hypothetical protein BDP55DRAFT_237683 [Colletotrichum godetiae]
MPTRTTLRRLRTRRNREVGELRSPLARFEAIVQSFLEPVKGAAGFQALDWVGGAGEGPLHRTMATLTWAGNTSAILLFYLNSPSPLRITVSPFRPTPLPPPCPGVPKYPCAPHLNPRRSCFRKQACLPLGRLSGCIFSHGTNLKHENGRRGPLLCCVFFPLLNVNKQTLLSLSLSSGFRKEKKPCAIQSKCLTDKASGASDSTTTPTRRGIVWAREPKTRVPRGGAMM